MGVHTCMKMSSLSPLRLGRCFSLIFDRHAQHASKRAYFVSEIQAQATPISVGEVSKSDQTI